MKTKEKKNYVKPTVDVIDAVVADDMLTPQSWSDGHGNTIGIHEGDPGFGDDDDGKGANTYSWDDSEDQIGW
ncbi:MAG: hypothetical protein IJ250_07440 [Bacteroidales bacterium]|nr:hypothetical protein [Bacteroidales bacterium]